MHDLIKTYIFLELLDLIIYIPSQFLCFSTDCTPAHENIEALYLPPVKIDLLAFRRRTEVVSPSWHPS